MGTLEKISEHEAGLRGKNMSRVQELQGQVREQDDIVAKILAVTKRDHRGLTDAEAVASDAACDEIRRLKGAVDEAMRSEKPGSGERVPVGDGNMGSFRDSPRAGYTPVIGKVGFEDLFGAPQADGFDNIRGMLRAVEARDLTNLRRFHDAPAVKAGVRGMTEGVPSEGGFLIGEQLWREVWSRALEEMIVLPRCNVWPMAAPTLRVPAFDDSDRSATLFGGLVSQWLAESAESTPVNPKFRSMILTAYKQAIYARASSEFNEDVPGGNPIETALPKALAWFMDYYLLRGNGVGQPLGVFSNPATITVAKETGQTADTICWANLIKIYSRNSAPSRSIWLASTTCLPQLAMVCIPIGTAGMALPVLKDNGTLSLLGRPVLLTEKLPVLGDAGDLAFVDFSQYSVGVRRQATVERTNMVSWTSDQLDWRIITRFDGQPMVDAPATRKDGTTESPFVVLGAR